MTALPNSAAARDIEFYFHPVTNARRHEQVGPMIISKGKGIHVYDDAGKEYIEAMAGLWSVAVGFGEERLVQAATRQMSELPFYHSFSHKSHPQAIDLEVLSAKICREVKAAICDVLRAANCADLSVAICLLERAERSDVSNAASWAESSVENGRIEMVGVCRLVSAAI